MPRSMVPKSTVPRFNVVSQMNFFFLYKFETVLLVLSTLVPTPSIVAVY